MNDELLNRARELLALRKKAPDAPWRCFGSDTDMRVIGGADGYTLFRIEAGGRAAMELAAAAHDMADTIRELLAEVERLELAIKRQAATARQLHSAERALMSADREAAEKARKMTDPAALESLQEANDILTSENETLRSRAEAAEARLRELASAEPVAWQDDDYPACVRTYRLNRSHALIRRPEMPS